MQGSPGGWDRPFEFALGSDVIASGSGARPHTRGDFEQRACAEMHLPPRRPGASFAAFPAATGRRQAQTSLGPLCCSCALTTLSGDQDPGAVSRDSVSPVQRILSPSSVMRALAFPSLVEVLNPAVDHEPNRPKRVGHDVPDRAQRTGDDDAARGRPPAGNPDLEPKPRASRRVGAERGRVAYKATRPRIASRGAGLSRTTSALASAKRTKTGETDGVGGGPGRHGFR